MSDDRARLAAEQAFLARFLVDEAFEAAVRSDPAAVAGRHGIDAAVARRLAAVDPARVGAFRSSRAHKEALRARARRPQA